MGRRGVGGKRFREECVRVGRINPGGRGVSGGAVCVTFSRGKSEGAVYGGAERRFSAGIGVWGDLKEGK